MGVFHKYIVVHIGLNIYIRRYNLIYASRRESCFGSRVRAGRVGTDLVPGLGLNKKGPIFILFFCQLSLMVWCNSYPQECDDRLESVDSGSNSAHHHIPMGKPLKIRR